MNALVCFLLGLAAGAYSAEQIREIVPILDPKKEEETPR